MQGHLSRFTLAVLVLLMLSPLAAFAQDADQAKITDIQVKGNRKVEAETIRTRIKTKIGELFYPSRIRSDIRSIYGMGYFDDVKVQAEGYDGGLRLIYEVVERPIVRSVSFEGNEKIDADKLREQVNITPFSIFNPALVSQNAEKLRLYYQGEGYFNASVLPIINKTSESEARIIFQVSEGDEVFIKKINFVGNEHISSRKLRKAMKTKRHIFLWSLITDSGTYRVTDFETDLERIKAQYYNEGYIQVSLGEPEVVLTDDKKHLVITIHVNEGDQFTYSDITVSGNTVFTKEELMEHVESEAGEVMNRDKLKDDIIVLTDLYGSKGYAYATIAPIVDPDVAAKTVAVDLSVEEGDQIFVNRIDISGNVKTRDKVIRRELKLNEGEIYDTSGIKKSYERLQNLDYFDSVEITPSRTAKEDEVNLAVRVKEKSTGSFSVGGGYSTIDHLVALADITQRNFLGLGQIVRFRGEFGSRRQNYILSITEPWLLDRPISLSLELIKEERVYTGYSKRSVGGGLTLGRRFWEYYGSAVSYSYSDETYFDVDPAIENNLEFNELLQLHVTSKVGASIYRDTRDNYIDPRRGSRNSLLLEYAGTPIGSENSYYKAIFDTVWFFPFYWDTAFSLHGKVGYAEGLEDRGLPLYERFYVGGINTVRGFDWGAVGPKLEDQFIGGNKEIILNAEYTFPILPAIKLRGVVFFDAGNAYDTNEDFDISSLRYSAGGGFRWISPMGLIRLEYGHNLAPEPGERQGKWEFSIGAMF